MEYCNFYPDKPATYYCSSCNIYLSDACSNEQNRGACRCFICDSELDDLGSGYSAEPFWRRLDKMFRYALQLEVLIFISVLAVLSAVLSFLPFTWVFRLILTGMFIKYCFTCLESTAMGEMQPPSIVAGYEGGLVAMFQLLFVFLGIVGLCALSFVFLGKNMGALVAIFLVCAFPAAVITLAINNSVLMAINPINLWRIISSVGMSYGILLAFIMIMTSSVALIQNLLNSNFTFIGTIAESFFSNFYTIVMFHMMGYMIFQYQRNLGFSARGSDNQKTIRTDAQKSLTKISMLMRNGSFHEVIPAYKKALKEHPNDVKISKKYIDFLLSIKDKANLEAYADKYLSVLMQNNRLFDLPATFKQFQHVMPNYIPKTPELRFATAQQCYEMGAPQQAVTLLKNLHQSFPDFGALPKAYRLLADILDTMDKAEVATKLRLYSDKIEKQRANQKNNGGIDFPASAATKIPSVRQKKPKPTQTAASGSAQSASAAHNTVPVATNIPNESSSTLDSLSLVPMDEH